MLSPSQSLQYLKGSIERLQCAQSGFYLGLAHTEDCR
ncbi:protein NinF [Escherichia coli]|nr:protein NinF [Escherichia coli]MCH7081012.1 hypothetical protein [Escherichia coli]